MENLKHINTLSGHNDRIWCVSWNYNGSLLASCSGDKSIKIWSFSKFSHKWESIYDITELHNRTVRCVAWSPCGNYLASAGFDGVVCIEKLVSKDPIDFQSLTNLASHNYEVKSVSWSADGAFLATCARDKTVHIWEIDEYDSPECVETLDAHTQDVKAVQWHPVVNVLVSSSYDNTIKVYREDSSEWSVAASLIGHSSTVWNVEFNCDGTILASCSDDKTVRLWLPLDTQSFSRWVCASVLDGYHDRAVYDLSWAPCSSLLATAGADNLVCLFRVVLDNNAGNGGGVSSEIVSIVRQAHDEDVNCCAWRPMNGEQPGSAMVLATGSDDSLIKLWQFSDVDMPID